MASSKPSFEIHPYSIETFSDLVVKFNTTTSKSYVGVIHGDLQTEIYSLYRYYITMRATINKGIERLESLTDTMNFK